MNKGANKEKMKKLCQYITFGWLILLTLEAKSFVYINVSYSFGDIVVSIDETVQFPKA